MIKKTKQIIYIDEDLFETLDIVEVAMNNDNNEFRKMRENLAKRGNIILHQMKINMQVLSKMSKKIRLLPQLANMKSFTENKIRLEYYQEVF